MIPAGRPRRFIAALALAALVPTAFCASPVRAGGEETYARSGTGTRLLESGTVTIKMLAEETNLGGRELELGELTLPTGYGQGPEHLHSRLEVLCVLSGVLGHTVNGVAHRIEPGMIAVVRPSDRVAHAVLSAEPVKALVIWAPAGEADYLVREFGFGERPATE